MAFKIERIDVWSSNLHDKPGALARKLTGLTEAGVDLDFLLCRRTSAHAGLVFVAPIKGARQIQAAKREKFERDNSVSVLRVEGPDKPGTSAMISQRLAEAGINIAGVSTTGTGRKFVAYLAFDDTDDAARALRLLHKL